MGPIERTSEEQLLIDIFGKKPGQMIAAERAQRGLTQRQLASKLGLTLREMKAVEKGELPKPRLEKRVYSMKYIEFLGYAVKIYNDWPVQDWTEDMVKQSEKQAGIVLDAYPCPPRDHRTRKNIARERTRLERAKRKK